MTRRALTIEYATPPVDNDYLELLRLRERNAHLRAENRRLRFCLRDLVNGPKPEPVPAARPDADGPLLPMGGLHA